MTTKFYILYPCDLPRDKSNPWRASYDCTLGVIVEAENEESARILAADVSGDEGSGSWLNPALSTCEELAPDGTPGVIMRDFHAG